MPLTPAEMDFVTNHNYELFHFDGPVPAHEALRSLDLDFVTMHGKFRRFQVLWQKQARREGPDELSHFWVEPASRSSFQLPWPTPQEFEARHLELYPEELWLDFEDTAHPLRHPRFVTHRTGRHSSQPVPDFSPEEDEFLDAYYDEVRSLTVGPCLTAVDSLEIPHGEINHLVGYRGSELLHQGRAWPQPHSASPPMPWPSLDDFKRRFFPSKPDVPCYDYVPLDRADFSAREHVFLAHYLHEITTSTTGPAHEYLRSQALSPVLMIPFLKQSFSYVRLDSSGKFRNPACKLLMKPRPPFEIPWGTRAIFLGRVLRFCEDESMKTLVEPFLPSEDSAYVFKPIPCRFFLSQHEEVFIRWYLAERDGVTGNLMPATQWLWTNAVYPSTLEALVHVYQRSDDHFYEHEFNHPLPPFMTPWLAKEDFEARVKEALEEFPELKGDPTALPGYRPGGHEERRMAWLRSIPAPPTIHP